MKCKRCEVSIDLCNECIDINGDPNNECLCKAGYYMDSLRDRCLRVSCSGSHEVEPYCRCEDGFYKSE